MASYRGGWEGDREEGGEPGLLGPWLAIEEGGRETGGGGGGGGGEPGLLGPWLAIEEGGRERGGEPGRLGPWLAVGWGGTCASCVSIYLYLSSNHRVGSTEVLHMVE